MKNTDVIEGIDGLVEELNKIIGVTYVLPFKKALAIDFDLRWMPEGYTEETMVSHIKKAVHRYGFNMLTEKKTNSKRIINLIPLAN